MDLTVRMKAAALIGRIAAGQTEDVAVVDVRPKRVLQARGRGEPWHFPVSTPEAQGVPSGLLEEFYRNMGDKEQIGAHAICVIRNGHCIASGAWKPYTVTGWHVSHSLCKSVTGLAIGILCDEGVLSLDDTLGEIFPPESGWYAGIPWQIDITVRNLLMMSSGVSFDEAGVGTETDYVRAFFESGREFEPGTRFSYNSMNSHILSAVVQAKTGMTMMAFLRLRLFMPLGITDVYWEESPTGVTAGGWGLYMSVQDLAKIGQLYLNKGLWEGKRIVSEQWLEESSTEKIATDPRMCRFGYGYHVWMGKRPGCFQFNGMLGQNVFVIPDEQLVVAVTAGSSEIFGTGSLTQLVYETFESDRHLSKVPLPPDPAALHRLQMTLSSLRFTERDRETDPVPAEGGWAETGPLSHRAGGRETPRTFHGKNRWREGLGRSARVKEEELLARLDGAEYEMERNAAGILPLFAQALQNNYAGGLHRIGFTYRDGKLIMTLMEGGQEFRIPVTVRYRDETAGTEVPESAVIIVKDEPWLVSAFARVRETDDGEILLNIAVVFPEYSNTRTFDARIERERIAVQCDELPHLADLARTFMSSLENGPYGGMIGFVMQQGITKQLLNRTFVRQVSGRRIPGREEL